MSTETQCLLAGITQGLSFIMMILGCVFIPTSIWTGDIFGVIAGAFLGCCGVVLFLMNQKAIKTIMED